MRQRFPKSGTNLSNELVSEDSRFEYGGDIHHDTLGWVAWKTCAQGGLREIGLATAVDGAWEMLLRTSCGHHGEPRHQRAFPRASLKARYFHDDDLSAVSAFVKETAALLLPDGLSESSGQLPSGTALTLDDIAASFSYR
ncbi:MAG: hypothetical protein H7X91_06410 [Burkholderiales bacterium]|nr:hypothetical protein [Burkholderiales bacterium]